MKIKMKIVAVIPAYNEEKYVEDVIIKTKNYVDEVIVIDDCSKDDTFQKTKKSGVVVLRHIVNLGKGAALKTGCEAALKLNATHIVALDADGQHDPSEIPDLIKTLNGSDIVFGVRKFNENMPLVAKIGNAGLSFVTKILFGISISDTQSGFRAFTSDAYKKIRWNCPEYAVENEIIARAGKNRLSYKEVNIKTIYNDKYKGTTFIDGFKILLNMLVWRLTI